MDPIDELVDAQLADGPPARNWRPGRPLESCPVCTFAWHGLPKNGCPGSFTESNS